MNRALGIVAAFLIVALGVPQLASAHDAQIALGGKKLVLKTANGASKQKFLYRSSTDFQFSPPDPAANGVWVLVRGIGPDGGKTELVELDSTLWKGLGKPAGSKGYKYVDKARSRGGIAKMLLKPGDMRIIAKGENWTWSPAGEQLSVWVHVRIGQAGEAESEWYCTQFGGDIKANEQGLFLAGAADKLVTCPEDICGDGEVDLGEECDDGNADDNDGCNADCTIGACTGQSFGSTMEAIQATIFDSPVYNCTNSLCHDEVAPQANLDLTDGHAYANLVNVPSDGPVGLDRVEPGDKDLSFLYEKLAAGTQGFVPSYGSAMPSAAQALTADHLEALRLWIQGGAPETGVVAGTADLLDGCLPDPTPLIIPVPDPPAAGTGVQFRSTPWPLPSHFENEICFATYYDVSGLVPESAKIPCANVCSNNLLLPCSADADCDAPGTCIAGSPNNPSGECFVWHHQALIQDPQSHHAFVRTYLGQYDTTHAGWGSWTYKFQDQSNPLEGQSCDPTDIDPALGYNPGCSSTVTEAVSCLGMGPPDLSNGYSIMGATGSGTTPTFSGSGVPYFDQVLADGVYGGLPLQGVLVWNSHAFNLTNYDTTMSLYLNMDFAGPADQLYPLEPIFDSRAIFVQDVPPYETREYCRTWTIPQGARVFMLTSHTHSWGVRWRTWLPPNTPCDAPNNSACGSPRVDAPDYLSTEYTDPLNKYYDPPLEFDSPNDADRTFLYCSLYDNGSTPESPPVKLQSTSPVPPLVFGLPLGPGGPCDDSKVACVNGPTPGALCGGDDSLCDSFPGAGDGKCDACPVRGGVTTGDEMFILQGLYYTVPVP